MPRSTRRDPSVNSSFCRHPLLPFVEMRTAHDATACYRLHTHPTLSIGIIDAGEALMRLVDRTVRLRAGDVVVIAPGVVHSCNPRTPRWSYRMFYFDADWARRAIGSVSPQNDLFEWKNPVRSVRARQALAAMSRAMSAAATPEKIEAALIRNLRHLLTQARSARRVARRHETAWVARLRRHLDAHADRKVTLAELGALVRGSPFAVLRAFRRAYGLTAAGYQLDCRINRARELLRGGTRSADAAYLTGFADQSHLHRCFRARVAATPRRYAAATTAVRLR